MKIPIIAFYWSHKVNEWKVDCVLSIRTKTHQHPAAAGNIIYGKLVRY